MGFGLGRVGGWVLAAIVILWVVRDPAQAGQAAQGIWHFGVQAADALGTAVSSMSGHS
jgi:hypothetical protein